MATGDPYRWLSGRSVILTTHLHLVQRLRMSGTILQIPPRAFMPWTGITFTCYLVLRYQVIKRTGSERRIYLDPNMKPHSPSGRSPKSQTYRSLYQDVVAGKKATFLTGNRTRNVHTGFSQFTDCGIQIYSMKDAGFKKKKIIQRQFHFEYGDNYFLLCLHDILYMEAC